MRSFLIIILLVFAVTIFTACSGDKIDAESSKIKPGAMTQMYDSVAKAAKPGTLPQNLPAKRK